MKGSQTTPEMLEVIGLFASTVAAKADVICANIPLETKDEALSLMRPLIIYSKQG